MAASSVIISIQIFQIKITEAWNHIVNILLFSEDQISEVIRFINYKLCIRKESDYLDALKYSSI